MSKTLKWLGIALMTLVPLAAVSLLSTAKAGKPQPPPPPLPVRYTMTLIPILPGATDAYAEGMNDFGDVIGTSDASWPTPNGQTAWLYDASTGVTIDLNDLIPEGTEPGQRPVGSYITNAAALNNAGQIGATYYPWAEVDGQWAWGAPRVLRYTPPYTDADGNTVPAQFLDLGWPAGYTESWCGDINSSGDIVGVAYGPDGAQTAFLWTEEDGTLAIGPPGTTLAAGGVNDSQQVAGLMRVNGEVRAFWYDHATGDLKNLGLIRSSSGYTPSSRGWDISATNVVVGQSTFLTNRGLFHAFHYTAAEGMTDLGAPKNPKTTESHAFNVNSLGHVVGVWNDWNDLNSRGAFFYTPANGMLDLWSLIIQPPPGLTGRMFDRGAGNMNINEPLGRSFSQISGTINFQAFLLTPDR